MEKLITTPPVADPQQKIHKLDLGSQKKKAIKNLKNGTGKLMVKVEAAIATLPDDKKTHVIVVICKKKRRKGGSLPWSSMSPLSPFNIFR